MERGPGGGLEVWVGGLWSAAEGRPRAPWSSGRDRRCGRQTASGAWAGTAHYSGCPDGETGRNSGQVKLYLGERTAKVVWQFLLTHDL